MIQTLKPTPLSQLQRNTVLSFISAYSSAGILICDFVQPWNNNADKHYPYVFYTLFTSPVISPSFTLFYAVTACSCDEDAAADNNFTK
jgi:hypothetical protein